MRKQYDLSRATRAKGVSHLARQQAEASDKTRIAIMQESNLLLTFRARAESGGTGYQTLINEVVRRAAGMVTVDEAARRPVSRDEISRAVPRSR
jgi:uncharacterized protein (DUF4415 family)